MRLYMLLQILRSLEGLAAKIALVRLERDMNPNMRGDMVPLHRCGAAIPPLADEVQVVGRLATDMLFANVFLQTLVGFMAGCCDTASTYVKHGSIRQLLAATLPHTGKLLVRLLIGSAVVLSILIPDRSDRGGGGRGDLSRRVGGLRLRRSRICLLLRLRMLLLLLLPVLLRL